MPNPGDAGSLCERCGGPTKLVGYGHTVVGAHCDSCDLLVTITADAVLLTEVSDAEASDTAPSEGQQ